MSHLKCIMHLGRRRFLTALGTTSVATFAGCGFPGLIGDDDVHPIGESVSRNGISVSFEKYRSLKTTTISLRGAPTTESREAPRGAEFLFAYFHVEHVGEQRKSLPKRGNYPPSNDPFVPYYKEEELERPQIDKISESFRVSGESLRHYDDIYNSKNLDGQVYDGEASGWLVNTIPADFETSETTYEVSYGGGTTTWKFTE
jgi:hypothetical protein